MQKLILILLTLFALFTFIHAFGATEVSEKTSVSIENSIESVEIIQ